MVSGEKQRACIGEGQAGEHGSGAPSFPEALVDRALRQGSRPYRSRRDRPDRAGKYGENGERITESATLSFGKPRGAKQAFLQLTSIKHGMGEKGGPNERRVE